ncbi:MAG: hemolysin family protein [Gammaproteobacteria bacterium]
MLNVFWLIAAFALVLLNAFFVAAEFGMVKLRETQVSEIKETYGLRGAILEQVHSHLDAYLSACQLGITLASLALGWIGQPAFSDLLQPFFHFLGIHSQELLKFAAFLTAFSLLSFLHIVIGELMPKSLAIRQSEIVSVWTAVPLYVFYWIMFPAIWLLNACSNFLLKMTGLNLTKTGDNFYSTEEIKLILSASHLHGELTKAETDIIEHTLEFADLKVTEVMRPPEDMVMLDIQEPVDDLLKIAREHRYSRYPVFDSKKNDIIGVLHVKDLFVAQLTEKKIENLVPYIRPILKVKHRLSALDLLHRFREGMPHFALVYMGKDNLLGFITLDNLLHVLLGRMTDEFHRTRDDWVKNDDGSLVVRGECSIYSLEKALEQDITLSEDEEELDTVAGLILTRFGGLPKPGDKMSFDEFELLVKETSGTRILKIIIYPKNM